MYTDIIQITFSVIACLMSANTRNIHCNIYFCDRVAKQPIRKSVERLGYGTSHMILQSNVLLRVTATLGHPGMKLVELLTSLPVRQLLPPALHFSMPHYRYLTYFLGHPPGPTRTTNVTG